MFNQKRSNCFADLILINGKILTIDSKDTVAEAVGINKNIISFVGKTNDSTKLINDNTKVIDLKGKLVIPGLIDSHTHPIITATGLLSIDCRDPKIKGIKKLQNIISEKSIELGKGKWIRGDNYNDSKLLEKRQITRWELDSAAPENPVYLNSDTGHQCVVNSLALNLAGITKETLDPSGGKIDRDKYGEATGLLYESAKSIVTKHLPQYTIDDIKPVLNKVLLQFTEWGITSTHDASGSALGIHCYQQLLKDGQCNVRIGIMLRLGSPEASLKVLESFGMESGFGDDWLRFISLKIMGDGSGAGGTACVYYPQKRGPCGCGLWATEPDDLNNYVLRAHKSRIRISVHAIGDKGIDAVLNAIENAQKIYPITDMRHRIEHNSLCTPKQLERIKSLGVTPSSSIGYMYQLGDQYLENFSIERSRWLHPHKTMINMGIIAGGNSDAPVAYYSPFIQMYSAVTRKTNSGTIIGPEEAISIKDALKIYTWNGAYLSKEETLKGSIEVGKLADLIILDRDITDLPPEELLNVKVLTTIVNGKIVFSH
ncbi:amidohydrolase [Candidatus Bathyarchaeota archaeon]|nr:amidohydrolase [Candidatus Bathyarchaeota archaeon]